MWLACFVTLLLLMGGVSLLVYALLALSVLIAPFFIRTKILGKRDRARGWRVEFLYGDSLRYGEFHQGVCGKSDSAVTEG
jgi:hypothetical protein